MTAYRIAVNGYSDYKPADKERFFETLGKASKD
jgi:hypothetical protein